MAEMAKIILSSGNQVLREIPLSKERLTIGRRAHNDIVIDDLAISGEHAVIVTANHDSYLEDLNSTNGTKVNGQPVRKHYLQDQDCVELALYQIKYVTDVSDLRGTVHAEPQLSIVKLKILSGPKAGSEIVINKAITTIGKPASSTSVILCRPDGYYLAHVDGTHRPAINNEIVGMDPRKLNDQDVIEMSGDRIAFLICT
jgi:hypothetical protein